MGQTERLIALLSISWLCEFTVGYNILLATMGGTKSHTVPFVALGSSLKARGHNVTLLSAFPGPAANNGLQEFVPSIFEVSLSKNRRSVSHRNINNDKFAQRDLIFDIQN